MHTPALGRFVSSLVSAALAVSTVAVVTAVGTVTTAVPAAAAGASPLCVSRANDQWRFGTKVGLDFSRGGVPQVTTSAVDTAEGVATMSDAAGKLLFYTDGMTVWGADDQPLTNGTGLWGHKSSTQSAVIVPVPGSSTRYYVFTAGANDDGAANQKVAWSIVDVAAGAVESATKNTLLQQQGSSAPVTVRPDEKIAAVPNSTGDGAWVVTAGGSEIYTWAVKASGVALAARASGAAAQAGEAEFSPDGTKLAMANYGASAAYLFDFDAATGVLSNRTTIDVNVYGAEFSPDSKHLYLSSYGGRWVKQYRVDTRAETASFTTSTGGMQTIETGPDGLLYVAQSSGVHAMYNGLDVILSPDTEGSGAAYTQLSGIFPTGTGSRSGLPNSLSCPVEKLGVDWGDAPASYGTSWLKNGPRHGLPDLNGDKAGLMLGSKVTADPQGLESADASSDTGDDGLVSFNGVSGVAKVRVTNTTDDVATLAGWLDTGGDGTFGSGERSDVVMVPARTTATYTLTFPAGLAQDSFARFRVFGGSVSDPQPNGAAARGEIEDYAVSPDNPSLALTKTATLTTDGGVQGKADLGDVITYAFTVRNTGNVALSAVKVTDPKAGLSAVSPGSVDSFPAGKSTQFSATYTVTSGDIAAAKPVVNSATASATAKGLPVTSEAATTSTPIGSIVRGLKLERQSAVISSDAGVPGRADKGDVITYTYKVTNTGNVPVSGISVTDSVRGFTTSAPTAFTIDAGGSQIVTATYVVRQADTDTSALIDSTARASGTAAPGSTIVASNAVDTTVWGVSGKPGLALTTTSALTTDRGTLGRADAGDVITYTYKVTNPGNLTVRNVKVTDTLTGISTPTPSAGVTVLPGEEALFSATYTVTQADADRGSAITDLGTATGQLPNGTPYSSATSGTETLVAAVAGALTLTKSARLTQDSDTSGKADLADEVTYTFTVRNTGTATVTGVSVDDTMPGLSTIAPATASLAPGEQVDFTATYRVRQSDVDAQTPIRNAATARGKGPGGAAVASDPGGGETAVATATPSLLLSKTAALSTDQGVTGKADVGDVIAYTFTVTNAGRATATDVVVTDPMTGLSAVAPTQEASIAPGSTGVFTASYLVTQDDVDAQEPIENTAAASGTRAGGVVTSNSSTASTPVAPASAELRLVTTAVITTDAGTAGVADLGDVITYTYTVSNEGGGKATAVSITDALKALNGPAPASQAVPRGGAVTFTSTHVVTQADIDAQKPVLSSATAAGTGPGGTSVSSGVATATTSVVGATSGLSLRKSSALAKDLGAAGQADKGDVITYTFTVTNTGNTTAKTVSVTDPMDGLDAITPSSVQTIAPGADAVLTARYTVTQADVDRGSAIVNVATASGTRVDGTTMRSATSSTETQVVASAGALTLTKRAELSTDAGTAGRADVGDVITYHFTARNTGNVTLSGLEITDPMQGLSAIDTSAAGDITPGDTADASATYVVTQADIDAGHDVVNDAGASATTPGRTVVRSGSATASTPVIAAEPGISLVKTWTLSTDGGTSGKADEGDVLTYSFVVENTGNVTVGGVTIEDPMEGLSLTVPEGGVSIAPSRSHTFTGTYVVEQADIDAGAPIVNVAAASATVRGGPISSAQSRTSTPVVPAAPGLTLTKTSRISTDEGTPDRADRDDVVTYTFVVENTGNVTIDDVEIDDDKVEVLPWMPLRLGFEFPPFRVSLEPGERWTFFADYTVTQSDVDASPDKVRNTATATGTTPDGSPLVSPPSSTSTPVVDAEPKLTLTKKDVITTDRGSDGRADAGDLITYTFTVTNAGNVTVTGVAVEDELPGLSAVQPTSVDRLAPGAVQTFTATYTVGQRDVDLGRVILNTATARGLAPREAPVRTAEASTRTPVTESAPAIALTKSARLTTDRGAVGTADAGDVITYSFRVDNTGNVAVLGVRVDDPKQGVSATTPESVDTLATGESTTFTATYVVTQADVTAGTPVVNTAVARGYLPWEMRVDSNESSTSTPVTVPVPEPAPGTSTQPAQPSNPAPTTPVPSAPVGPPAVTSKTSVRDVAMAVDGSGQPRPVEIHDEVTIDGLVGRSSGRATPRQGSATLYGPVTRPTSQSCAPAKAVGTVRFTSGNGVVRTPSVTVREPGYYVWVATVDGDAQQAGATHACGLGPAITRVHREAYGSIEVQTGFAGWLRGLLARASGSSGVAAASVKVPAIRMSAALTAVGVARGEMVVPHDVRRGGWLARSAAPGEQLGATVIAGHVSDRSDRPGAFGRLRRAATGQVVLVRDASGRTTRFRITSITTQPRNRGLSGSLVSTTSAHRLVLVTCTGKVTYPNGRFHYTKNLVVVAQPIG